MYLGMIITALGSISVDSIRINNMFLNGNSNRANPYATMVLEIKVHTIVGTTILSVFIKNTPNVNCPLPFHPCEYESQTN
jgi:hypothetical protein